MTHTATPIELRLGESIRSIEVKFEGSWTNLVNVGATRWSYPDNGKTQRYNAMADKMVPLFLAAPALLAALRTVEWAAEGYAAEGLHPACPACRAWQSHGHAPDCQLAKALRDAEGETE